jgi:hypothetical protein
VLTLIVPPILRNHGLRRSKPCFFCLPLGSGGPKQFSTRPCPSGVCSPCYCGKRGW